jgi:hypothetical protein
MLGRDFGAATDHDLQLSAMGNRPSQPRTALLIVDVQVGLVELMSAERQRECSAQDQNAPGEGARFKHSSDLHST